MPLASTSSSCWKFGCGCHTTFLGTGGRARPHLRPSKPRIWAGVLSASVHSGFWACPTRSNRSRRDLFAAARRITGSSPRWLAPKSLRFSQTPGSSTRLLTNSFCRSFGLASPRPSRANSKPGSSRPIPRDGGPGRTLLGGVGRSSVGSSARRPRLRHWCAPNRNGSSAAWTALGPGRYGCSLVGSWGCTFARGCMISRMPQCPR
mmetsp:Transcript_21856/g.61061  ORF Transcript_21856/g.61061 Transcript_21856/m.61061 type:complete len:205 (-) Transcript_21856:287-901(-)